jgi:hypothetical protein
MSKTLERLFDYLEKERLDALIAMSGENFRYVVNT